MKTAKHYLIAAALLLYCLSAQGGNSPALLFSQPPELKTIDVNANIYICRDGYTLTAYDMDSGEQVWRRKIGNGQYLSFSPDCDGFLMYTYDRDKDGELNLCCKKTGKTKFSYTYRSTRRFPYVRNIQGSDWLQQSIYLEEEEKSRTFLYSPDGEGTFIAPDNAAASGFMPDGKTLFGVYTEYIDGDRKPTKVVFWELGSDGVSRSFPLLHDVNTDILGVIPPDKMLLYQYRSDVMYRMVVVDMYDGSIQRTATVPEEATGKRLLVGNAARVLVLSEDERTVWLLDSTDDTVLATLHEPGNVFLWNTVCHDAVSNTYIASVDGDDNVWVWAVTPDATRKRIIDGSRFFTGNIEYFKPPYFVTADSSHSLGRRSATVVAVYRFQDRRNRKTAEWEVDALPHCRWQFCDNGRRGMVFRRVSSADGAEVIREGAAVYEQGISQPILEVPNCEPSAFAPDGNHIAVTRKVSQEEPTPLIRVIHVDSGKEAASFQVYFPFESIVFSPDSRRIAIRHPDGLTVVTLADGYPQSDMYIPGLNRRVFPTRFSASGNRLLSRGEGRVWLNDAETGQLLHSFIETERFTNKKVHVFNQRVPDTMVNFAGAITDRVKNIPWMDCAFTSNDTRVITAAEWRLLRVWDARSGRQLYTIKPTLIQHNNSPGSEYLQGVFSENGNYVFIHRSARADLWDVSKNTLIGQYNFYLPAHLYSTIIVADDGTGIYFWKNNEVHYLPVEHAGNGKQ